VLQLPVVGESGIPNTFDESDRVSHILISTVSSAVVPSARESLTKHYQMEAGTLVANVWFLSGATDGLFGFMVTVFGWSST